jgi:hypothetical protein
MRETGRPWPEATQAYVPRLTCPPTPRFSSADVAAASVWFDNRSVTKDKPPQMTYVRELYLRTLKQALSGRGWRFHSSTSQLT